MFDIQIIIYTLLVHARGSTCFCISTENVGGDTDLFEGDMQLNPGQRAVARGLISGRGSIRTKKWTGAVLPYTIDSSLGKWQSAKCKYIYLSCFKSVDNSYVEVPCLIVDALINAAFLESQLNS